MPIYLRPCRVSFFLCVVLTYIFAWEHAQHLAIEEPPRIMRHLEGAPYG